MRLELPNKLENKNRNYIKKKEKKKEELFIISNSFRIFVREKRSIIFQRSEATDISRLEEPHGSKFRSTIKRQRYFEITQYTSLIERLPGASHDISLTGNRLGICVTCGDRVFVENEASSDSQLDSQTSDTGAKRADSMKKRKTNER